MENNDFKIMSYNVNRYCIADKNYNIIDTANGYGYKTKQSAIIAMKYKYMGGKQKKQQLKIEYNKFIKSNESFQYFLNYFYSRIEIFALDILKGRENEKELLNEMVKESSIKIPKKYFPFILDKVNDLIINKLNTEVYGE